MTQVRHGGVVWSLRNATRGLGTVDEFIQDSNNCIVNFSLERPYQV